MTDKTNKLSKDKANETIKKLTDKIVSLDEAKRNARTHITINRQKMLNCERTIVNYEDDMIGRRGLDDEIPILTDKILVTETEISCLSLESSALEILIAVFDKRMQLAKRQRAIICDSDKKPHILYLDDD
jgi:hypothetical protein